MLCLITSQTSGAAVPKDGKRAFVEQEKQETTQEDMESDARSSHTLGSLESNQKHQESRHRAIEPCHFQEHDVVDVFVLWRPEEKHRPPTPVHVGERVHEIFDLARNRHVA